MCENPMPFSGSSCVRQESPGNASAAWLTISAAERCPVPAEVPTRERIAMLRYSLFALLFAAVSSAATVPPKLRLSEVEKVRPLSYRAELNLDPARTDFSGTVHIRLSIPEPLSTLWLNASRITAQSASLKAGDKSLPATVVPGGDNFLGFQFPPVFTGRQRRNNYSLRRPHSGGRWRRHLCRQRQRREIPADSVRSHGRA